MFTPEVIVDSIQNSKKQFVSTFVTNETMAEAINEMVDAQTEYTKQALKTGQAAATAMTTELLKGVDQVAKMDYTKFGESIVKAYGEMTKFAKVA